MEQICPIPKISWIQTKFIEFTTWKLWKLCRDQAARQHIEYLFQSFHEGRYKDRYYAYNMYNMHNMSNARYKWLNGTVHHYQQEEQSNYMLF